MMNYVAMQIVTFCIVLWENPRGSNHVGVINQKTKAGWFPSFTGQDYMIDVILVTVITVLVFAYLRYTKQGYELQVVGESVNTARYAGIDVKRVIVRTMMISSAICGIAGAIIVGGASHTISTATAGRRGFTAIVVAIAASAVMPTFNEVIKNPETTESFTAVTNTFADYLRGQTTFSQVIASGKTFYHTVIDLMNAAQANGLPP